MEERRTAERHVPCERFWRRRGYGRSGCRFFLGHHLDSISINTTTFVTFFIISLLSTIVHSPARKTWRGTLFFMFWLGEARFEQQGWLAAADWTKMVGVMERTRTWERAERFEARFFL